MNPKDQTLIINSIRTATWQIPTDRINLVGLRLKRGTTMSVGLQRDRRYQPDIHFSRGSTQKDVSFDLCLDLGKMLPIFVSVEAIDKAINEFGVGGVIGPLLISVFSVVGTVTLELLFDETGSETNKVRISLKAGGGAINIECKLAEIIEFVGETGIVPEQSAAAPCSPPATIPEQPPHDPCAQCVERLTGVAGQACLGCDLKGSP
jgi:hypothetical protein